MNVQNELEDYNNINISNKNNESINMIKLVFTRLWYSVDNSCINCDRMLNVNTSMVTVHAAVTDSVEIGVFMLDTRVTVSQIPRVHGKKIYRACSSISKNGL